MEMRNVESTRIHSVGHDPDANGGAGTLRVRFWRGYGESRQPGPEYDYTPWSAGQHAEFLAAESLGKHFGAHIKDNAAIQCQKVTP